MPTKLGDFVYSIRRNFFSLAMIFYFIFQFPLFVFVGNNIYKLFLQGDKSKIVYDIFYNNIAFYFIGLISSPMIVAFALSILVVIWFIAYGIYSLIGLILIGIFYEDIESNANTIFEVIKYEHWFNSQEVEPSMIHSWIENVRIFKAEILNNKLKKMIKDMALRHLELKKAFVQNQ